ncbi:MAG TPA: hypothetical protein VK515_06515 [Rhizomicrobium sp.]|nr:hypothetical protein [Rhizomicrobium sp.]
MRILSLLIASSLLAATSAYAADTGALAPGKPAGVHAAQSEDLTPFLVFGAAAVGIGIALAVSSNNDIPANPPNTSTTTTGTTG